MSNVDKLKYNGVEYDLGKSIDSSLTQSGQAADAKSVGDAIASQNTNINTIKERTDNVEDDIETLQTDKVDKTTPLLNFDDTATDPLTDDGALADALTALGILSDVIPSGGGSLYLKKALTEMLEKINDASAYSSGTLTNTLPSNIDLQTGVWTKYGHIATVTVVFKVTTSDITAGLQQIASGAPKPKNGNYEFVGMTVSGTLVPKRLAVTTGGGVFTWYSGTFTAGQTYMGTAVYICN